VGSIVPWIVTRNDLVFVKLIPDDGRFYEKELTGFISSQLAVVGWLLKIGYTTLETMSDWTHLAARLCMHHFNFMNQILLVWSSEVGHCTLYCNLSAP